MARGSLTPLEALNDLRNCLQAYYTMENVPKVDSNLHIIEKALKDYENLQLKHRSMQDAVLDDFKKLKALEIIKECFVLNGFDELIPNRKWFESEEKQALLKEILL